MEEKTPKKRRSSVKRSIGKGLSKMGLSKKKLFKKKGKGNSKATTTISTPHNEPLPTVHDNLSLPPPSTAASASTVDLSTCELNGTWEQDRLVDVDKYLTHSNVPWLVKKMILKIKPKMTIELTDATFKISMTGGQKTKVDEGEWGVPFKGQNPRGDALLVTTTYRIDKSKGLCVVTTSKNELRGNVELMTRYMKDGECVLLVGPKISVKDGKTEVSSERFFKRKQE
ncbi:hypothetical protein TL16_g12209 [Triparma laevis f. inornata]|uniref:Uncharacterized protein n=1 Tax=Triparma laevis f. inornata TaxID=1714386 RepID=A0A9W7BK98_9STRA|nr:hypothetical protein TL16_g12209 [Triparma laevis f. inornata]